MAIVHLPANRGMNIIQAVRRQRVVIEQLAVPDQGDCDGAQFTEAVFCDRSGICCRYGLAAFNEVVPLQ